MSCLLCQPPASLAVRCVSRSKYTRSLIIGVQGFQRVQGLQGVRGVRGVGGRGSRENTRQNRDSVRLNMELIGAVQRPPELLQLLELLELLFFKSCRHRSGISSAAR